MKSSTIWHMLYSSFENILWFAQVLLGGLLYIDSSRTYSMHDSAILLDRQMPIGKRFKTRICMIHLSRNENIKNRKHLFSEQHVQQ